MNIKWYPGELEKVDGAVSKALEMTGEAIRTDLIQQQTVPFAEDPYEVAARKLGISRPRRSAGKRAAVQKPRVKPVTEAQARKQSKAMANAVQVRKTQRQLLKEQAREMARRSGVVPGELQGSIFVDRTRSERGEVSVVSNTPYARRLYFHPEYNFYRGQNKRAGGEWYKPYLTDRSDWVRTAFSRLLRRTMQ